MTDKDTDEAAFPVGLPNVGRGITAVAEIMASDMGADRAGLAKSVAAVAYLFADAMLKERSK